MKKWSFCFVLCLPALAFADGKVFKGRDFSDMRPVLENEQRAFIMHRDGRETMILAVNFDLAESEKAFWLFPVLGRPQEVRTDIVDTFPQLRGRDVKTEAQEKMKILAAIQFVTQPYLYPFLCCPMYTLAGKGIEIHSEIEKDGLKVETLTGTSIEDLVQFLETRNIQVNTDDIGVYENYLNEQCTLIFVTIASADDLAAKFPGLSQRDFSKSGRWPCVYVDFPAEKAFFPLKPTGSYDDKTEINLKVAGYVKPADASFSQNWAVDYFSVHANSDDFPSQLSEIITGTSLEYTRLTFYHNANLLTKDLYMVPADAFQLKYARAINAFLAEGFSYTWVIFCMAMVTVQSWSCAGFTGLILKKKWLPYANLGFGNMVTLFGLYLSAKYGTGFLATDLRGNDQKKQRSGFVWLFAFFFVVSSVLLYIVLSLPLMLSSHG